MLIIMLIIMLILLLITIYKYKYCINNIMNSFGFILSYFLLNEKLYDINIIKNKLSKENILMYGLICSLNTSFFFYG